MRNPETIRPVTLSSRISLWKTKEEEQAARQLTAEPFAKDRPPKQSPLARQYPSQIYLAHGFWAVFVCLSVQFPARG